MAAQQDNQGTPVHLFEPVKLTKPFWTYFQAIYQNDHAFLLDSALPSSKSSKYSFMGFNPSLIYRARHRPQAAKPAIAEIELEVRRTTSGDRLSADRIERTETDAFVEIRSLLSEYSAPVMEQARQRFPLLAGAVGYFGYEAGRLIEHLPDSKKDHLGLPDIHFAFFDHLLCHCHATGETYASVIGRGTCPESATQDAQDGFAEILSLIRQCEDRPAPTAVGPSSSPPPDIEVAEFLTETGYCDAVRRIKQHIDAGDVYQACMTQQFRSPLCGGDAWDLYIELRYVNPAPFACFLKAPDFSVVSASPERYLQVNRHGRAESRPIKGTRPRGKSPEVDAALYDELAHSVKDQAENVMIVDLVRNDFGRVCKFGSVVVPEMMAIESYATVFQMVSTVQGELNDFRDALDLIRASFPGGSMTGAPKIEAMKILDRLEPVHRGIYSGAIGYLDYQGAVDLNIVIRSFVVKQRHCYYNAGGAVVADSDPRAEYLESLDKVRALKAALIALRQRPHPAGES